MLITERLVNWLVCTKNNFSNVFLFVRGLKNYRKKILLHIFGLISHQKEKESILVLIVTIVDEVQNLQSAVTRKQQNFNVKILKNLIGKQEASSST